MCLYANHIQNMVAQTQTCGIVTDREAEISEAQWLLWSRCQSAKMEVQDTRQHNNSVLPESNWTAWWVQSGSMIRHHYFHCILNSTLPSNFALLAYLPLARHSKTQQDIARKSGLHPCITAIIPQPALVTWFCFMMAIISSFNGSKPLWLQRNIHGEHPRLLKASPTFAAGSENTLMPLSWHGNPLWLLKSPASLAQNPDLNHKVQGVRRGTGCYWLK